MGSPSRARWVAWSTAALLTAAGTLIVVGSSMFSRAKHAVATPMSAEELAADGDRRLARGDVVGALEAYDEALMLDAADPRAYYRAGVALSYLGDREQAATMFLWVVRSGAPASEEVRRAREWLQAAGLPVPR
jgi:tetratricopeptide (TPR) repeat protein